MNFPTLREASQEVLRALVDKIPAKMTKTQDLQDRFTYSLFLPLPLLGSITVRCVKPALCQLKRRKFALEMQASRWPRSFVENRSPFWTRCDVVEDLVAREFSDGSRIHRFGSRTRQMPQ
jgi:hypothetical protein